jgi:hypothetical protein
MDVKYLALHSSRFTHAETNPGTHWIGGWMDPTGGLEYTNFTLNLPTPYFTGNITQHSE